MNLECTRVKFSAKIAETSPKASYSNPLTNLAKKPKPMANQPRKESHKAIYHMVYNFGQKTTQLAYSTQSQQQIQRVLHN